MFSFSQSWDSKVEEAVDCYKRNFLAREAKARKLFRETEAWFFDRGEDALFSFENVCDALDLDPAYLRAGLRRWKENQLNRPTLEKGRDGDHQPTLRRVRRGKRVA